MNSPIFVKYWTALLDLGIASETDSAIALALRLAIDEATKTAEAKTAQNDADAADAMVAEIEAMVAEIENLREALQSALNQVDTLRAERNGLRQQLAELDADNADLARKLSTAR